MNNAGTVLLTLADMSVIQAEVEVDETNIPNVQLGQPAKITIDAIPDRTFKGHVTEIGNSPIQAADAARAAHAGDELQGGRRCSTSRCPTCGPASPARPTSRPRRARTSSAVPIPAVAVRELVYDANGQIVKEPRDRQAPQRDAEPNRRRRRRSSSPGRRARKPKACSSSATARAEFVPIKMGIAGDKYFEVLSGLKAGDQVITGPYNSVRGMADGDLVKVDNAEDSRRTASRSSPGHEQVPRIGAASRSTRSGRPSCGRS